jgi:predicted phosphoadenosine phosphosulfate sulfurtransferase
VNKKKILHYIKTWESQGYCDGIPDEVPNVLMELNLAPSYKAICIAIMKNDVQLQFLGYGKEKCNAYNAIKRNEINMRNNQLQWDLFND